ncbi:MAG: redox-regulated ATPase YchF [Elusimicrobia bacterium]|nr:redox-regulated ATPase YchF [Elusimicrobiota bacterium]
MEIGIVGLPNVGKSTLFNALTSANAASSNYPFTTIDPNLGVAQVPDSRLRRLGQIFHSEKITPAAVRFVDIAGLVQGASRGEGLGNQFLAHIREVDAVLHLIRLFENPDVMHTLGHVDPQRDAGVIETELALADLASVERQIEKTQVQAKTGEKAAQERLALLEKIKAALSQGNSARTLQLSPQATKPLGLLTDKPILLVGNTHDPRSEIAQRFQAWAQQQDLPFLILSGKIEAEIAQLQEAERQDFLAEMGLEEPGLNLLIREAYKLLDLITFFTAGPKESRAWTVSRGAKAPEAAGKIHSDMQKGFIRVEVYPFEDLDRIGSEAALREKGLIRTEGKDYTVREGDVMFFKFQKPS